jgi:hypothetical protein
MGLFGPTGGGGGANAEQTTNKNQPNGYAGLDANTLVAPAQLPLATTSTRGAMSGVDKSNLNQYGTTAGPVTIQSWSIVNALLTINTGLVAHQLVPGNHFEVQGGGLTGSYIVSSTPTVSQILVAFVPLSNNTGTGGTIFRGGRMPSDYTRKLTGIQEGAQVNVKPDWNAASGSETEILNKPAFPLSPILLGHGAFSYAAGGNTRFFAQIFDLSAVTTAVERNFRVPQGCTIRAAIFASYIGGTASAGHSGGTLRIRNKTTNTTQDILTYDLDGILSGELGTFTTNSISINLFAGSDYVIEMETGTFTTAPTSVRQMLTIYY